MKMNFFHATVFFCAMLTWGAVKGDDTEEQAAVEMDLTIFDLQDLRDTVTRSTKDARFNNNFKAKIRAEAELHEYISKQRKNLEALTDVPDDLQRRWNLLIKPGDYLLPEKNWSTIAAYVNANEELLQSAKIPCINGTAGCVMRRQDIWDTLSTTRDLKTLQETWKSWQEVLLASAKEYNSILTLVHDSAAVNDQNGPEKYWESLTEYEDGYELARNLWEEINPLYMKLQDFVKARLFNYYNISENSTEIPIYLLGSKFGMDWSNIADIAIPGQLNLLPKSALLKKTSKQIYQHAEKMVTKLGLKDFGLKFWSSSSFNDNCCQDELYSYCDLEYSEVITCSKVNWKRYLDIHETAMKVTLVNEDYSWYVFNDLRHSIFDEAVTGLSTVYAVENFPHNPKTGENERKMRNLMLIALRTLPKLAFYLAADTWRLNELEQPSANIGEAWENTRKEIQMLRGVNGKGFDFLEDLRITSNKPYLNKYLGTFLQFQLIDFYAGYGIPENGSVFDVVAEDSTFSDMVKERNIYDPKTLLSIKCGIDEISAYSLLNYFKPLEEYLDTAPLEVEMLIEEPLKEEVIDNLERLADQPIEKKLEVVTDSNISDSSTNPNVGNKNNVGMYAGLFIVAAVAVVVIVVLVRNSMRKRRKARTNNRRFET